MKSAIREGDFKMYKRYDSDDYELYRLYQDGRRADLEEQTDLAESPEFASVVQRLAAKLDSDLATNDAEMPYLNPAYKGRKKASAEIANSSFNASDHRATLTVQSAGPAIKEAYVIYGGESPEAPLSKEEQKQRKRLERQMQRRGQEVKAASDDRQAELRGMKFPAMIDPDGHSVSAVIPQGVVAYRFLFVDANHFLQHSEIQHAK